MSLEGISSPQAFKAQLHGRIISHLGPPVDFIVHQNSLHHRAVLPWSLMAHQHQSPLRRGRCTGADRLVIKATDPKAKKAQAPKASARGHALWKLQVRCYPRAAPSPASESSNGPITCNLPRLPKPTGCHTHSRLYEAWSAHCLHCVQCALRTVLCQNKPLQLRCVACTGAGYTAARGSGVGHPLHQPRRHEPRQGGRAAAVRRGLRLQGALQPALVAPVYASRLSAVISNGASEESAAHSPPRTLSAQSLQTQTQIRTHNFAFGPAKGFACTTAPNRSSSYVQRTEVCLVLVQNVTTKPR